MESVNYNERLIQSHYLNKTSKYELLFLQKFFVDVSAISA